MITPVTSSAAAGILALCNSFKLFNTFIVPFQVVGKIHHAPVNKGLVWFCALQGYDVFQVPAVLWILPGVIRNSIRLIPVHVLYLHDGTRIGAIRRLPSTPYFRFSFLAAVPMLIIIFIRS